MVSKDVASGAYDSKNSNVTYYGLRTDTKPVDCGNGSCFIEMDTGKLYFFDATGKTWIEWGA